MKDFKLLLTCILAGITLIESAGQVKQTDLFLGTGLNHMQVRDRAMSPMIYSGANILFYGGIDQHNDRYDNHFEISYIRREISPDLYTKSSADYLRGEINYLFTPVIKRFSENSKLNLGGHFLFTYSHTIHSLYPNNDFSYYLAWNLGPTFSADHHFTRENGQFYIHFDLSFPVISYCIRPSIASETQEGSIINERYDLIGFLAGGKFVSLNRYQRISTRLYTKIRLAERLSVFPVYQWDFSNYRYMNQITQVKHIFSLSFVYSIGKK